MWATSRLLKSMESLLMSTIAILNLNPVGSDLFSDSETFITDLADADTLQLQGGSTSSSTPLIVSITGIGSVSYYPHNPVIEA